MTWDLFLKSPLGSIFIQEYNLNKEAFQPLHIEQHWNISTETEEFLTTFGWLPGDNGFLPFTVFEPTQTLLRQRFSKSKKYNYKIVAKRNSTEIGILNTVEDTLFSLYYSEEIGYFAKSIPLVVCYGMLEKYVANACFMVENQGFREHIPDVLKNWQYAKDFFKHGTQTCGRNNRLFHLDFMTSSLF